MIDKLDNTTRIIDEANTCSIEYKQSTKILEPEKLKKIMERLFGHVKEALVPVLDEPLVEYLVPKICDILQLCGDI